MGGEEGEGEGASAAVSANNTLTLKLHEHARQTGLRKWVGPREWVVGCR